MTATHPHGCRPAEENHVLARTRHRSARARTTAPARRRPSRAIASARVLAARALVVTVLAAGAVVAPVTALPSASAEPVPVEPEAQVLAVPDVPAVTEQGVSDPSAAPPPGAVTDQDGQSVEEAEDAPEVVAPVVAPTPQARAEPAPGADAPQVAATGAVETDDFRMVSVSWNPDSATDAGLVRSGDATVQVRVRSEDGWTGWEELGVEDAGPDAGTEEGRRARATVATEPLWVSGGADAVDVRVTGTGVASSADLAVNLIDPKIADADPGQPGGPLATASAATVGMPNVISRRQWGADESLRTRNCTAPDYTREVQGVFVHHTAGTNVYSKDESASIMRGIYYYHTQVQKWCDVGYNALVDKYGQIFEGRYGGLDKNVVGAHAAGFNAGSWGVSVLGNYETARPTPAIADALAAIIGWKMSIEKIDPRGRTTLVSAGSYGQSRHAAGARVTFATLSGHRDAGFTSCPGAYLYATLPALANRIATSVREQHWEARDSASPGSSNHDIYYGSPGSQALSCDIDGDGRDGIAVYSGGLWNIRDDASSGPASRTFRYGGSNALPVCGDWNGDGRDGIGVYVPDAGVWYLRESATDGNADRIFQYGFRGTVPVAGDWSRSGHDGIGVHDTASGTWFLRGTADAGRAGAAYQYGFSGATPVTGDWDGDGADSTGVMKDGRWYLRDSITPGRADRLFDYGVRSDMAVTGRWAGGGRDGIAVVRTWPPGT